MTEKNFNQLRFDICENVRLHTQQPSMGTLLELDLYPDVEIKDKGNHLKIEGYLRLKGVYLAEEETEQEQFQGERREELSYIIPVEITLPADRAEMEHISAEIESFDYQVLSPFELQIDAILLIDGLIPEKLVEDVTIEQDVPMFSGAEATLETKSNQEETEHHLEQQQIEEEEQKPIDNNSEQNQEDQELPPQETKKIEFEPENITTEEPVKEQGGNVERVVEAKVEEECNEVTMDEHKEETNNDEFSDDWLRWLVRDKEENFTSMRMIIVQDDDSVQRLSERYDVTPSEIRRLNRLEDSELEKGQIVYIPNSKRITSQQG